MLVRAIAMAAAIGLGAGCYSRDYAQATASNANLLADLADKLSDYCRNDFRIGDRPLSSEEMGEFYYALNKASAFSSSTPREAARASHVDFDSLIGAYEKYVHASDSYRIRGTPDPATLAALQAQHDLVRHLAGRVASDLKDERR
jgi:hypothetical protein